MCMEKIVWKNEMSIKHFLVEIVGQVVMAISEQRKNGCVMDHGDN